VSTSPARKNLFGIITRPRWAALRLNTRAEA
jgi:hypothetical protein